MRSLILYFISAFSCFGAVLTRSGQNDFKTTKVSANTQTLRWAQVTGACSITISCWVKHTMTDAQVNSQSGNGARQGYCGKGNTGGDFGLGSLQFQLGSTNERAHFMYAAPANTFHQWLATSQTLQTNEWAHFACRYTYGDPNSFAMFKNGSQVAGAWIGTPPGGTDLALTNNVSFHTFIYEDAGQGAPFTSFFVGAMCDLAIWTNLISDGEIKKLASKVKYMPIQVQPASLIFFWPMDTTPVLPSVSGANNIDVDRTPSHFNMDVGGLMYGERVLSYQPNE